MAEFEQEQMEPVEQADVFGGGFGMDVLDTPEVQAAAQQADAHRGIITSVTTKTFNSGSTGIVIGLQSMDAGFDDSLTLWPPAEFVENIHLNPSNPEELPDTPPEGKKMSSRDKYARVISNSAKNAEMQKLRALATEAGRTLENVQPPTNFEEWVALHDQLLNGLEVVFTRNPDKNSADPRYNGRLRVNAIHNINQASNPKFAKDKRKAWIVE